MLWWVLCSVADFLFSLVLYKGIITGSIRGFRYRYGVRRFLIFRRVLSKRGGESRKPSLLVVLVSFDPLPRRGMPQRASTWVGNSDEHINRNATITLSSRGYRPRAESRHLKCLCCGFESHWPQLEASNLWWQRRAGKWCTIRVNE